MSLPKEYNGQAWQAGFPNGTAQSVAITGTATVNAVAFNARTMVVRLQPTVNCFFRLGTSTSVSAGTTSNFAWAGLAYTDSVWRGPNPQDNPASSTNAAPTQYKYVSVITAGTGTGILYLTELE